MQSARSEGLKAEGFLFLTPYPSFPMHSVIDVPPLKEKQIGLPVIQEFPNGFQSWLETYFEASAYICKTQKKKSTQAYIVFQRDGQPGLYKLAKDFTDKFEIKHAGNTWESVLYMNALQQFLSLHNKTY